MDPCSGSRVSLENNRSYARFVEVPERTIEIVKLYTRFGEVR